MSRYKKFLPEDGAIIAETYGRIIIKMCILLCMCILLVYWRHDLWKNARNGQLQSM